MQTADLKLFKSRTISDGSSNGGRESYVEVVSGSLNNLFPAVSEAERTAGITRWRKVFFHNVNSNDEPLNNAAVMAEGPSSAEDQIVWCPGTQRNTQGDLTNPKRYAAGLLAQGASSGSYQIQVSFENSAQVDLATNDVVWLYGQNGQAFLTVSSVSWNGNTATINLVQPLPVDFLQGEVCSMVLQLGTLQPSFDSWTEVTSHGTYNEATYPPVLKNWGTVEDDWTILFTSSTAFTCSGLYEGTVGSGSISSDFSPTNPNTSTPYFTIRAAGWGGTWQAGDRITFTTHPASGAIWLKEIVPAGAQPASSNTLMLRLHGE